MSRNLSRLSGVLAVLAVLAGCGEPTTRLNVPPQGTEGEPSQLQPFFTYSVDNAMLSDQSLADIHFVPHTTELNSLGTTRLTRMARIMETYGGTVRYAPDITETATIEQRMVHVREFLETEGVDMARVEVKVARPGTSHTPASQAMLAMEKGMAIEHSGQDSPGAGE